MNQLYDDMFVEAKNSFIDGKYSVAEPLLQQLMLKNSGNPEIHQMLATIYYDKGQFNKAIRTFKRALEIDPTYTDASIGLSIVLNDLGRYEEGQKTFEEAQKLLKRQAGQLDSYAAEKIASKHEEIADLYFQYKQYPAAIEQLIKAKTLSQRKVEIGMRLADCFIKASQHEQAIKELRQLVRDYPQYVPARLKIAEALYNSGRVADAVMEWERILLRDPENPVALRGIRYSQSVAVTNANLE